MSVWIQISATIRLVFVLLFMATGSLSSGAHASDQAALDNRELVTVTIPTKGGRQNFMVETANTRSQRAHGLMFRTRLPERQGMLFDFGSDQEARMWMKDTPIPLDMIFIQSDGRIHRIEQNTEPESLRVISSNGPVRAVLEVAAGAAKKYGIAPGDRVINAIFAH
jgi:uncharacterized membrane protein (UPF0127 family)